MNHYRIVEANTVGSLQTLVNDKISFGYVPIGGVYVDRYKDDYGNFKTYFYQAMVIKMKDD